MKITVDTNAKPEFKHDCKACQSLGRLQIDERHYDIYFCEQPGYDIYFCEQLGDDGAKNTVVARRGDLGHDYISGITSLNPALCIARAVAEALGLLIK